MATKVGTKKTYSVVVENIQENGVTSSLVVNIDKPIVGMDKTLTKEEEHKHFHASVSMLLNKVTDTKGRYLKYKVGNAPHKYVGVSSVLCLLYEGATIELERTFVAKGTDLNGVPAKADMWHTSDLKVTFKQLSSEDQQILAMLMADVKPRTQQEIKPLF